MLVCPSCQATYAGSVRFCTRDATALVPAEDDPRIGTLIGNYRLVSVLGRGGMGVVYKGEHVYIEKPAAIKVLHDRFARESDAVARFLREARAASRISHPNIVEVLDFGELPDVGVFLVMEYLDGVSLAERIAQDAPLPLFRILGILTQMARALSQAHAAGIVHRDLKPENVMLATRAGRRELVRSIEEDGDRQLQIEKEGTFDLVKILDFGIAKFHEPLTARANTVAGSVFGTPEYLSPEAARGEIVDLRADVYALGVMFFEMATGQLPFDADTAVELMAAKISGAPPSPRAVNSACDLTPAAEALTLRMMATDRAARPQSMDEVYEELLGCYGDVAFRRDADRVPWARAAGVAPTTTPAPREEELRRRRRPSLTEELSELLGGEARALVEPAVAASDEAPIPLTTPKRRDR